MAKKNNTGLPEKLKSGIEILSGLDMDDVKINYNSQQPAAMNASSFAQGHNIKLAPDQDKHLPTEAWHVVQQRQGRVKAVKQAGVKTIGHDVNDLEREADKMGRAAFNKKS